VFGIFTYSAIHSSYSQTDNTWFAVKYFIIISILIYFLWIFSKFITKKNYVSLKDRKIKVLERVALSSDKYLLLVELENFFYLIGVDKNGMHIIDKRDDLNVDDFIKEESGNQLNFMEVLKNSMNKKDK